MRPKPVIIISVVLTLAMLGTVIVLFGRGRKNYERVPSGRTFSGEWIVYSRSSGQVRLKSFYTNGVKHGTETSWDQDSWNGKIWVDTVQTYSNGVLHGTCTRFEENGKLVVRGDYVNGNPWEGTFLAVWDEVFNSPFTPHGDLLSDSAPYYLVRYTNGVLAERASAGAQGFKPIK